MSESTKIEGLVKTAMDKVREMADCETVVGKPIVTADGTTIIPVSKISVGFASGGSDLPTKSTKETFGGGSGGGVTIQPIAFITVYKGEAKLLQLSMNATKENAIINMVPEVIDKITDFLGKKRFRVEKAARKDEVGIVRGLAWTEVGGDTLEIEVNTMPGEGNLKLTGQLGDVMKESAEIALSLVRALLPREEEFFKTHDFHLHVPEGAVPKDGPSAGVTMTTAIYSAVTGKKVLAKVAMTGEITLRGRVLPIGGLKEKLLAAKQAGIQKVVVPKENKPDVEELEEEITEGMQIVFAGSISDVLKEALVQK